MNIKFRKLTQTEIKNNKPQFFTEIKGNIWQFGKHTE